MDDLGLSTDAVGVSSMFTGEEEVFAFARAVVRSLFVAHLTTADETRRTVENYRDGKRAVGARRTSRESNEYGMIALHNTSHRTHSYA